MLRSYIIILLLCLASSGVHAQQKFWGMTSNGGVGLGVVFKTDADGTDFTVVHNFQYTNRAQAPRADLTEGPDGKFYGMTSGGGAHASGALFVYDPAVPGFITIKHSFNTTDGKAPQGSLLLGDDNLFYGMTHDGGANAVGVLFSYDPIANIYTKLIDFTNGASGKSPSGTLISGDNGLLYGMTDAGGVNNEGVLFEFNSNNNQYTKKFDFGGVDGSGPCHRLTLGTDGLLYGMTVAGGTSNFGTVFTFDLTDDTHSKKFDFTGTPGAYPVGRLTEVNGKFYGLTSQGGTHNLGSIIEYDPSTGLTTKKHSFDGAGGDNPNTSMELSDNGKLYGMTYQGGEFNAGVLFEYDAEEDVFEKKINFTPDGPHNPLFNSPTLGTDGNLYGLTWQGGPTNEGTLFVYNPTTNVLTKKVEFNNSFNGSLPLGDLTRATNGKLYGLTRNGGANNAGTLFEIDPANDVFTKRIDFDKATTGANPPGSLTLAPNGKLYGMTQNGGDNDAGVLFEYDPFTDIMTPRFHLTTTMGRNPIGRFTVASNGKLYAMTATGGASGLATLVEFDPSTNTLTKKIDFNGTNGAYPDGNDLTEDENGILHGATYAGGANNKGVLFQFDPATGVLTKKFDFDGTAHGTYPKGALAFAPDGKMYGMTRDGGSADVGCIFQYDPATGAVTKKFDFNGANARYPYGGLNLGEDGMFYGMTRMGGSGSGVIFKFDPATSIFTSVKTFNGTDAALPHGSMVFVKNEQTVTFDTFGNKNANDAPFDLTASASTGFPITFTSSNTNVATISGNTVTIVGGGTTTISAVQAGSATYYRTVVEHVLTVYKLGQTLTFDTFDDKKADDAPFALTATATSGLGVILTSSNTNVATISGNIVTLVGGGTTTITASQPGTPIYESATSIAYPLTVYWFTNETATLAPDLPILRDSEFSWVDFDMDGDLDFFITGQTNSDVATTHLWRNGTTGARGIFTDVTATLAPGLTQLRYAATEWGDYDNDGDPDLLITGDAMGGIYVGQIWKNGTTGSAGTFTNVTTDIANGLQSGRLGDVGWIDFDNDGDLDLALTGQGRLHVWRNGGATTSWHFTDVSIEIVGTVSASNTSVFDWADFDSDGDLDFLLTATVDGNKARLFKNGTTGTVGAFNDVTDAYTEDPLIGAEYSVVKWSDFDNDGDPDFYLSSPNGESEYIGGFWRNGTIGQPGIFTNVTTTIAPGLPAVFLGSCTWNDFDSDGDADFFVNGSGENGKISEIWKNGTTGTIGIFTNVTTDAAINLPGIRFSTSASGDFDGDGDIDLLLSGTSSNGTSQIWKNNGAPTNASPAQPTGLGSNVTGPNVQLSWTAPADDSTPSISLRYNLRIGTSSGGRDIMSPQALNDGTLTVVNSDNAGITTHQLKNLPAGTYYWSVQAIDQGSRGSAFSAEGTFEIQPHQALVFNALADKTYGDAPFALNAVGGETGNPVTFESIDPAVVEIDGNMVTIHRAGRVTIIATQEGDAEYGTAIIERSLVVKKIRLIIGAGKNSKVVGDSDPVLRYTITTGSLINGDEITGELTREEGEDLGQYWIEQGTLTAGDNYEILFNSDQFIIHEPSLFAPALDVAPNLPNLRDSELAWADFDNDGDLDLILTGQTDNDVPTTQLWMNDGVFIDVTADIAPEIPQLKYAVLNWGDYDNDGDVDLIIGGETGEESIMQIWKNDLNESGIFSNVTAEVFTDIYYASLGDIHWIDFDNDGDLDVSMFTGSSFNFLRNQGSASGWTFTDVTSELVPAGTQTVYTGEMDWADLDDDGDLDFIITPLWPENTTQLWMNGDNGSTGAFHNVTESIVEAPLPKGYYSVVRFADFDNDGDADFYHSTYDGTLNQAVVGLWQNGTNGEAGTFTNVTAELAPDMVGTFIGSAHWNDFDADGDLDLLLNGVIPAGPNVLQIWKNGTTGTSGAFVNVADEVAILHPVIAYGTAKWGDFDGDGDVDFAVSGANHGGGYTDIWRNTGSYVNVAPNAPTDLTTTVHDNGKVEFDWGAPTDDSTPSIALQYSLRIGTTPGGLEVSSPNALYNGMLTTSEPTHGVQGTHTFVNLLPGTYYWSVQAIDHGSAGSEFSAEGSFEITPFQVIAFSQNDVTYGDAPVELIATGGASGNSVTYESSDLSIVSIDGNMLTILKSGEVTITASQAGNNVYEPAEPVAITLTVHKAELTVSADNKERTYGSPNPSLTFTYTGFVNGDTKAQITEPTISTNATATSDAGEYAITLTGTATNYALNFVPGILKIKKADQTITFDAIADKTLGNANFNLGATSSSGLAVTYQSVNSHVTLSNTTVTLVAAGPEKIIAKQAGNINFNPAEAERTFCILPSKPVVTTDFSDPESPVLTSSASAGNQWYRDAVLVSNATDKTFTVSTAGLYTVKVSVEQCTSQASDPVSILITGIASPETVSLKVYPNPVTDHITIEFAEVGEKQVAIVDVHGRGVHNTSTMNQQLEVATSEFSSGVYVLKVRSVKGAHTVKFVKQ